MLSSAPMLDADTASALDLPRVSVIKGGVRALTPGSALLHDGREVFIDFVLYCTGSLLQYKVCGGVAWSSSSVWGGGIYNP